MFLIKICRTVSVHFFSDLHEGLPSSKSSLHSRFQREYLIATLAGPPVKNYQLQKQPPDLQREQLTLQKKIFIFFFVRRSPGKAIYSSSSSSSSSAHSSASEKSKRLKKVNFVKLYA